MECAGEDLEVVSEKTFVHLYDDVINSDESRNNDRYRQRHEDNRREEVQLCFRLHEGQVSVEDSMGFTARRKILALANSFSA